ncbi:hypothetical protein M758_UG119700 [Ceratodon purpureus]|nr:hypothetical protein M758_UG119700 [Ceratodon purpureus]
MVHWRRAYLKLTYPNCPALADLVRNLNKFEWNDTLYVEMQELVHLSGLMFSDYLKEVGDEGAWIGACAANPITFPDDHDDNISGDQSEGTESRAGEKDSGVVRPTSCAIRDVSAVVE